MLSKEQEPVLNEEADEEPSDISLQMNNISADQTVALGPESPDSEASATKAKRLTSSVSSEKASSPPKVRSALRRYVIGAFWTHFKIYFLLLQMMDDEDLGDGEAFGDILPLPHDLPQDDELMNMLMNEGDDLSKNDDPLGAMASSVETENHGTDVETADQPPPTPQIAQDEGTQPADDNKDDLVELLGPSFNLDAIDTGKCYFLYISFTFARLYTDVVIGTNLVC